MKVDIQDVSSCKKKLRIEIPPEDINAEFEKAYEEIRTSALVPGFRKGKVPRSVLKMRFGEHVKGEVIEKQLPPAFEKAIKDADLEVLRPLDTADMNPPIDELSVKENEPLIFEVTVDVRPEITTPDLETLEVEKGEANVTQENVDEFLYNLREERAKFVPVEDRAVQEGDYVTLSILATSQSDQTAEADDQDDSSLDGEVLMDQREQTFEAAKSMPIPELLEHLIGMKPEDEKEFSISLSADRGTDEVPEPPEWIKDMAGKPVNFRVILHKITEKVLPPLDDEFAKDLGEDDLQHLTAGIWNHLIESEKREQRKQQEKDLIDQLLEKSDFEVPEFLVDDQVKNIKRSVKAYRSTPSTGEDEEMSEEELSVYQSSALNMIKKAWIFDKIAKNEDIEATDEDIEAEVKIIAESQNRDPQRYMKLLEDANRLDGIREAIWENKIVDLLIEKASPKRTLII